MIIRDAQLADHDEILALNEESVRFLSPLTPELLQRLHRSAAYFRVVEQAGQVSAFLLALREGAPYDSPNYLWFAARYPRFLYIDRIVVSIAHQGAGLGKLLYTDIVGNDQAKAAEMLTCEFDVDPPNENSARFHASFGFQEVGSHCVADGRKRVSLQSLALSGGTAN
ncbi:GNAT family N-acetyltransferase [Accumulibacter sp.]|uniref:GNAT family N-acetyltransferase n=1 Tax=Accumulibacter sp. TaxID=2053492 RepID=UPI0028C4B783|nr:GNAT family N-acetyltransferase [Accumulibacter sp.]